MLLRITSVILSTVNHKWTCSYVWTNKYNIERQPKEKHVIITQHRINWVLIIRKSHRISVRFHYHEIPWITVPCTKFNCHRYGHGDIYLFNHSSMTNNQLSSYNCSGQLHITLTRSVYTKYRYYIQCFWIKVNGTSHNIYKFVLVAM